MVLFPAANFSGKFEFVALHVDAAAAESDCFSLEAETLFYPGVSPQFDLSSCAKHTMPGQPKRASQNAHYLPCGAGMPGSAGH